MPAKELKEFLDDNNIKYVTVTHSTAYTAQEVAALTHTKGKDFAKTVMVTLDGTLAMAVVPASYQVDMSLLKEVAGANTVALASESEFRARFPGCETGAMSPFGNLFDMPVFLDESLAKDLEIAFNAGSHNELIRLSYEDFERLVKPKVLKFAARMAGAHTAPRPFAPNQVVTLSAAEFGFPKMSIAKIQSSRLSKIPVHRTFCLRKSAN